MSANIEYEICEHEIYIRRVGDEAVPPQPMPTFLVGDRVRYSCDDGEARIEFSKGSPYEQTTVLAGQIVTVRNIGTFRCQCFIDCKDGSVVGWKSDPSPSGADHDVPR